MTDQPGHTRLFCRRCRRPLENHSNRQDTVTLRVGKREDTFVHDQCGGDCAHSVREAKA